MAEGVYDGKQALQQRPVVECMNVSNAFYSISHGVIRVSSEGKEIHPTSASYIGGMFDNCLTVVRRRTDAVKIEVKRGVKKGDPLSSLVFDLVIADVLEKV